MEKPLILAHPTSKGTWVLREGIEFEYSGRMDESEIILNDTRHTPGTCLGFTDLYQIAFFCGKSEYLEKVSGYLARPLVGRKLNPRATYKSDRWSRHTYLLEDRYKHFKYSGGSNDGFLKVHIYDNDKIEIRSRWGYKTEPKVDIELYLADILALIEFLEQNPSTELELKHQNPFSAKYEQVRNPRI